MKHDHDLGLAHDLATLQKLRDRRAALRWIAGASLIPIIGCGGGTSGDGTSSGSSSTSSSGSSGNASSSSSSSSSSGATPNSCDAIPSETGGPFPGDGTNGPNALTTAGVNRSDIRSSFDSFGGVAAGTPMTLRITLVNVKASCAALAGYAIYVWHCDQNGKYSLYELTSENYLRGLQETAADGTLTFTTIFPGCYPGRWPHIHFEVYDSVANATSGRNAVKTSQLALPEAACKTAYAAAGYETSVQNLTKSTLATDNVFSDGSSLQLPVVTGNSTDGFVASLVVGISV